MQTIDIKFPNGETRAYASGSTPLEIAEGISHGLAKKALAAKIGEKIVGLNEPINGNADIQILTFDDEEGKDVFWHSSAHLMAQAVKRLYPQAQLGIGPPIDDGFYYDIDLDKTLTPEDFDSIESEMTKIVEENLAVNRREFSRDEAIRFFKDKNENLKIDLIADINEGLSAYTQGEFTDLCRGPHLPSTGKIGKYFKLLSVAGAYWRGDEKNKMLQRLYATAYPDKKLLKEHLFRIEEAKKRDHRKLGRELDLFSIQDEVGGGLILWHPKGAMIRNIIETFWKEEHFKNGYDLVYTPHVAKLNLWDKSGHSGFYKENMYAPIPVENVEYQLKPMNCPFHMTIYNSKIRSYRDLPIRFAELGTVYRYERSGVLHGLMRVRGFTQDDAHIYCTPEQLTEEIQRVLNFTMFMLNTFGFETYDVYLSTRPEKYVGTLENWDEATAALQRALEANNITYKVDPGEGVFYGPKIDIKIRDVLGRSWQCSTIQVDFNLPEKFNIEYVDSDSNHKQPITIHRALLGSLERFFGILIEHYAGNFPLWLAPTQVRILPIADRHFDFAKEIDKFLVAHGIRVECDDRNEKIGYKIREAEVQKIPYMLIVGDKEVESRQPSVRKKGQGDLGEVSLDTLLERLQLEIKDKKADN
ncbi:MAG: threonine--tRNA ligase [Calditrichales bacterium]|nr:MAG: threonine--tRNA ligase [Calditrichales bacterium]